MLENFIERCILLALHNKIHINLCIYIPELFHTSMSSGGRKRPFVPKHMKHAKQNDAKRRKLEKNDENHRGSKSTNKSDGKHMPQNKKKNMKFEREDSKFGGGKTKTNVDKSNSSGDAANKKKLKKTKSKKTKGKKKSHRNKNK